MAYKIMAHLQDTNSRNTLSSKFSARVSLDNEPLLNPRLTQTNNAVSRLKGFGTESDVAENELAEFATSPEGDPSSSGTTPAHVMDIHLQLAGVQLGPYNEKQVREYIAEGLLSMADKARIDGTLEWIAVSDLVTKLPPRLSRNRKKRDCSTRLRRIRRP